MGSWALLVAVLLFVDAFFPEVLFPSLTTVYEVLSFVGFGAIDFFFDQDVGNISSRLLSDLTENFTFVVALCLLLFVSSKLFLDISFKFSQALERADRACKGIIDLGLSQFLDLVK